MATFKCHSVPQAQTKARVRFSNDDNEMLAVVLVPAEGTDIPRTQSAHRRSPPGFLQS